MADDTPAVPGSPGRSPIALEEPLPPSAGAEVFRGRGPDGEPALAWRWEGDALPRGAVASLAQLIETLQGPADGPGARVLHGSVSSAGALVAFAAPAGRVLTERVEVEVSDPGRALDGALGLVDALEAAAQAGVVVGRWSLDTVLAGGPGGAWILAAPGVHALPCAGPRPAFGSVLEAAACAPEVATGAVDLATAAEGTRIAAEAYALGVTLFYALSAELPLGGGAPAGYLRIQLSREARPLREARPQLGRHARLGALVAECLQRAAEERPRSYAELRRRLREARKEAERLASDAAFLPARVSDTMEIRRSRLREEADDARTPTPNRLVQLAALVLLVAILLFLVLRQTRSRPRPAPALEGSPRPAEVAPPPDGASDPAGIGPPRPAAADPASDPPGGS